MFPSAQVSPVSILLPQLHCQPTIQKPDLPTTSTLPSPSVLWRAPRNWAESWSLGTWAAVASGTWWGLRKGAYPGTYPQAPPCISFTPSPQVNTKLSGSIVSLNHMKPLTFTSYPGNCTCTLTTPLHAPLHGRDPWGLLSTSCPVFETKLHFF